jgi:hypothetical protein
MVQLLNRLVDLDEILYGDDEEGAPFELTGGFG